MKTLGKEKLNKTLSNNELDAIYELKNKLSKSYPEVELILFGSKARNDSEEFSDIDIFILIDKEISHDLKDNIIEIVRENRSIFFRKMGPFNLTLIGNCQKEIIKPILESFSLPERPRF